MHPPVQLYIFYISIKIFDCNLILSVIIVGVKGFVKYFSILQNAIYCFIY